MLCCHVVVLAAIGGVLRKILHERIKTALIGDDADGLLFDDPQLHLSALANQPLRGD